jgi:hypothetical protein
MVQGRKANSHKPGDDGSRRCWRSVVARAVRLIRALRTKGQSSLRENELRGEKEGEHVLSCSYPGRSVASLQWTSTPLSSLNILLRWLQFFRAIPKDLLRIFSSPSREELSEQLTRENQGLLSTSVMAAQFLQEKLIGSREMAGEVVARGNEPAASVAIESTCNESSWGVYTLDERGSSSLEKRRVELEHGGGGDHDIPYRFTGPSSTMQVLVWMKLLVMVQDGTLPS